MGYLLVAGYSLKEDYKSCNDGRVTIRFPISHFLFASSDSFCGNTHAQYRHYKQTTDRRNNVEDSWQTASLGNSYFSI